MSTTPSSTASRAPYTRRCAAAHAQSYYRKDSCQLLEGHSGPHLINDPAVLGVKPSERWLEHGIVHLVTWFNFVHTSRKREIWTACGMARDTTNRTRNNLMVTCLKCATK